MIASVYIAFVLLLLVMHRSVHLHVSGVGSGACNCFKDKFGLWCSHEMYWLYLFCFSWHTSLTEKYDFSRPGHAVSVLPWLVQRLACIQCFVLVKVCFFYGVCVCYFVRSWKSNNTVLHIRLYACHKSSPMCICVQKDHMCMLSVL